LLTKYRGGAQGKENQQLFCVGTCAHTVFLVSGRFAPTYGLEVLVSNLNLVFEFLSPVRRRVAETGQGILTNMFEHVDA
jgi:hypothetical protein